VGPRLPASRRRPRSAPGGGEGPLLLGRYRLLQRLGAGGFGEVFRARDELLHRDVALKRIGLGPDGDAGRAAREAQAAARLAHPGIVALYEAWTSGGDFFLISELVEGDTLARLIHHDLLRDEEVLEIGLALCSALRHAHARGVVHRDIKPQNVLVPREPGSSAAAAKLTDFGGATLAGEEVLTRTGDVLGTLAYMAPEQSDGRAAGPASDLYSLALVLYEALSGVNPVRGATPADTARRIGKRIPPLERARGDLPRELTRALDRGLSSHPRDRGTLEELGGALEHSLRALAGPAGLTSRPAAVATEEEPPSTRTPAPPEGRHPVGAEATLEQEAPDEAPARVLIPRTASLVLALLLAVWQAATGRAGVALLLAAAAVPLLALPRRSSPTWLAALLAPALGTIGLAGVFPALAGQARRWRLRASMGALAYWWLVLAEPLLSRRLWLGAPAGTPSHARWEGSIDVAAAHVIAPLLSPGVAAGAALWALGAAVLPWLVRGRGAALDLVAATMWTAALAAAAARFDGGLAGGLHETPRGLVAGAVLAAAAAVGARALRGPV
jgi:hypothetical protein